MSFLWNYQEFKVVLKDYTCFLHVPRGKKGDTLVKAIEHQAFMKDSIRLALEYLHLTNGDPGIKNILENTLKTVEL